MPSLEDMKNGLKHEHNEEAWHTESGRICEREEVLTFLRTEAKRGTADWEYRLTKLAEAIERGDHEQ